MRARNGRTGSACGGRSISRTRDGFASPSGQEVDGTLIMDRPKVNKVIAHSVFVVAGAFELVRNSGDDGVDTSLARDEILSDGHAFKSVVCRSVAFAGAVAGASEIVREDLTFELIWAIRNTDEVVEDSQGRAECFGGAG